VFSSVRVTAASMSSWVSSRTSGASDARIATSTATTSAASATSSARSSRAKIVRRRARRRCPREPESESGDESDAAADAPDPGMVEPVPVDCDARRADPPAGSRPGSVPSGAAGETVVRAAPWRADRL